MNSLNELIQVLWKFLEWWVIINPWEQAIFVRAGKNARIINAGIYFKIPFVDKVYVQSVRKRMVDSSMQNLTTKDGHTIALKIALSYSIEDILKLYHNLYHPETTLSGKTMSMATEFIYQRDLKEVIQEEMIAGISARLEEFKNYGLKDIELHLLCFSAAKTYRLIQDQTWLHKADDLKMDDIK